MDFSFLSDEVLWGVAIGQLIIGAGLILIGFIAQLFVRRILNQVLSRVGRHGDQNLIHDVNRLLTRPLGLLINVALWNVVIGLLNLPQEPVDVNLWVSRIGMTVLIVVIGYGAFHLVDVFAGIAARAALGTETRLDDQLVNPVSNTVKLLLALVLIAAVMDQFDYSATGLIASLSIGGLAVAFAAKDTLANIFGSILIFSERPFQIGDVVRVNGIVGSVEEVGIRSTRIRQFDQTLSILPNQTFTTSEICNLSKRESRRVRFEVTLTHDATVAQLDQFLTSINSHLEQRTDIHTDQSLVRLTKLDTSGLAVLVQAFTISTDFAEFMQTQEEILMMVRRLSEEQSLPIMPAKDIRLSGKIEDHRSD
ncbi:MAG: mechanosensitive ion channel family protein [Bacteroidetes bacterium]|nr:mechanosensitive ion channel family protein [Bacteroidota bacterium]